MSVIDNTQLSVSKAKRAILIIKLTIVVTIISIVFAIYTNTNEDDKKLYSILTDNFLYYHNKGGVVKSVGYLMDQEKVFEYFLSRYIESAESGLIYSIPLNVILILLLGFRPRSLKREHIKGAKVEKKAPLFYKKEKYSLAGVHYPANVHKQHTMITGAPGSGKSQLIGNLLRQIRDTGDIAIIYDKADLMSNFYQSGDFIYNPLDERSVRIDPMASVHEELHAMQLAAAIVKSRPNVSASGEFFIEAARSVLTQVLIIAVKKEMTLKEAVRFYKSLSDDALKELLARTEANKYVAMENFADISSTIDKNIRALDYLHDDSNFKLEEFLNRDSKSWLWLTAQENKMSVNSPIITLIIENIAEILLSGVKRNKTIWIIADEFDSLARLEAIPKIITEGRKYGAAVVLGFQDISQLEAKYGANGAQTLIGSCSTLAVLRAGGKTAKAMSDFLGDAMQLEQNLSESSSSKSGGAGSVSMSERTDTRSVVLAGELSNLQNLTCYIKTAGLPIIGPRKIKFRKFKDDATAQFIADQSQIRRIRKDDNTPTAAPTAAPAAASGDDESFWS